MKNRINIALMTLSLLTTATQSYAYTYTFHNHTNNQIAVAIQFRTEDEPLYKRLIHPHTIETFGDGEGGVPQIKESYCLAHLRYVKAPTSLQKKHKFAAAPWREIGITWTPLNTYYSILEIVAPHRIPVKKHKVITATTDYLMLSERLKSIKRSKPQTLCMDRSFDIVEDEHGKIFFLSPLLEPQN
jgi:hypothetical protein